MARHHSAVATAEAAEKATRGELDAATARRAELECQQSAAQSDADSARRRVVLGDQRVCVGQNQVDFLGKFGFGMIWVLE